MIPDIIIITGKDNSGKSFLARNIMSVFNFPVYLFGRSLFEIENPFYFCMIDKNTDLLIIDDVPKKLVNKLLHKIKPPMIINRRFKKPISLFVPKVIVVSSDFQPNDLEDNNGQKIKFIETWIEKNDKNNLVFFNKNIQ